MNAREDNAREDLDVAALEARLVARREELLLLGAASASAREPVALDQSRVGRLSRMDALQDQAMAVEAERRRRNEVARIDAARARIGDGEFGFCVACGEAIGAGRLDHDPAIAVCIDCARGPGG